ncbi:hypothetical protein FUT87_07200, partial [Mitsuaria sp. TWR114]|uniref:hypothetical protein n=1 Tax=Mitsuaria sp. TWR114 TaxID=2601731 RepID=UPI0011C2FC10
MTKKVLRHRAKLSVLAASALVVACGGGGGEGGGNSGAFQAISFNYPGGATLLAGPVTLKATADSGLPVHHGRASSDHHGLLIKRSAHLGAVVEGGRVAPGGAQLNAVAAQVEGLPVDPDGGRALGQVQ